MNNIIIVFGLLYYFLNNITIKKILINYVKGFLLFMSILYTIL